MKKNVLLLISLMLVISTSVQAKSVIGNQHQQLLLMISNDWQATQGKLYQYEKKQDKWQLVKGSTSVTLGRTGLAWGVGLHDKQAGQYKKLADFLRNNTREYDHIARWGGDEFALICPDLNIENS